MKNAAFARVVSVFILGTAASIPACGPPALPVGPQVKLPQGGGEGGKYQCRDVTGASEPWLVEWDPPAKARFQSASADGVLLVKYQGCSLEVLYGCEVKGSYKFAETTRSLQTEHIGNEAELFAKLPIGALNLAGEFKKGDRWSLDYVVVGTRTATVKDVRREALSGRCAGATHLVQGMAVGAYQLSAGASRKVGAEVSLKGVGGAGGKVGSEARRLRQDGQYELCVKKDTAAVERGCQAIVKLYLQPVSGYAAVAAPPVPGSAAPAGAGTLPPVGAELGHLRVEGSPRGARVDLSGPAGFKGPKAAALPRTWQNLPAGRYQVKVRAAGHDPYETTVTVLPDRMKLVPVRLQKAYGQLTIGGTPAGARVQLSGPGGLKKVFGLTASFTFPRLRRGSYTIEVTRTGYTTVRRQVRVAGGQTTRVAVKAHQVNTTGGGVAAGGRAGIQWVAIPGGSFIMGSSSGSSDEKPVHRVTVGAFSMLKTEVTVAQYRACLRAGKCTKPDTGSYCNWGKGGRDAHPVNCVDWSQARRFCRWAGGRLPSEAEWEYAARSGGKNWKYPWGNAAATCSRAVMGHARSCTATDPCGCGKNRTWPVCSKTAGNTTQGLCDMAGNVWEWTEDCWHGSYSGAPTDGSAWTRNCEYDRVSRGGSGFDPAGHLRATPRSTIPPAPAPVNLGVRCAR